MSIAAAGVPPPLHKAWRLGDRPNLKQMYHDACANRVTAEAVELKLLAEVRATRSLTRARGRPARACTCCPSGPAPSRTTASPLRRPAARGGSNAGRPSRAVRRFIDETTGPDRPRVRRNAVVPAAPSTDGFDVARTRVREYLGWGDAQAQLRGQPQVWCAKEMLVTWTEAARRRMPGASGRCGRSS